MASRKSRAKCPCVHKGLRGSVAEHRAKAEKLIREATTELRGGDCMYAAQAAHAAESEAEWLPGPARPGTIKHRASIVARDAEACLRKRFR